MRTRPFFAARVEDRINRVLNRRLLRRGWRESISAFTGYGTEEQIRVLARVTLHPPSDLGIVQAASAMLYRRGWRNFMSVARVGTTVTVSVGGLRVPVDPDRGGYLDVRIKNPGLRPGWHQVELESGGGEVAACDVQIIDRGVDFGIVSDIDDTILSTWLPRPMLAAWNSLVLTEQARQAVPGMARLYKRLLREHPGAPIIYVSTGAWNTYPMIQRFFSRHGFPHGAMLLTDWGPTNSGWFRSGPDHKRRALRELARDLPGVRWLLIGDDGQHDPALYAEFAQLQPQHVRGVAIRELTAGEAALAHGLRVGDAEAHWHPETAPEVRGQDGDALGDRLSQL